MPATYSGNSADYWAQRQRQLSDAQERDEAALMEKLHKRYLREEKRLEREIEAFYGRYGEDNVIAYRLLMQQLSAEDARLLIEDDDAFAAKYPQYAHLIPARENIYRLNRLEGLQHSIYMNQLASGAIDQEQFYAHTYKQGKRAMLAAQQAMGHGSAFSAEDEAILKLLVNAQWSNGQNYSEHIWGSRQRLAKYLQDDFAQGIARGEPYAQMMRALKDRYERVAYNDAYRLIYTEGTYITNEASMTKFAPYYGEYTISTAGPDACGVCRAIEKRSQEHPYRIEDRKPGESFPPFHPRCRCSYLIVLESEKKRGTNGADGGIIKARKALPTYEDPMREVTGAGLKSHPAETSQIIKDLQDKGVEIVYTGGAMAYSPGLRKGQPGQYLIDKEASYAAWKHEEYHVLFDEKHGWMGFAVLEDTDMVFESEKGAYQKEIDMAEELGRKDIADRLRDLLEAERKRIYNE